jgi:hypothetical protein
MMPACSCNGKRPLSQLLANNLIKTVGWIGFLARIGTPIELRWYSFAFVTKQFDNFH